jgi:hypothetical protein
VFAPNHHLDENGKIQKLSAKQHRSALWLKIEK